MWRHIRPAVGSLLLSVTPCRSTASCCCEPGSVITLPFPEFMYCQAKPSLGDKAVCRTFLCIASLAGLSETDLYSHDPDVPPVSDGYTLHPLLFEPGGFHNPKPWCPPMCFMVTVCSFGVVVCISWLAVAPPGSAGWHFWQICEARGSCSAVQSV